jgi:peptidoglycan hydrolase CwlO-like protein
MEFDPAIVLFGAVVLLLVAILIGVLYAARDRRTQVSEEWVQDLDKLDARLEAIAVEVALLAAQIRHLEGVEGLQREVTYLREENKRLQEEWRKLLGEVARITELLGRQPP